MIFRSQDSVGSILDSDRISNILMYYIPYTFIDKMHEISHYHFLVYNYSWAMPSIFLLLSNADRHSDKSY